MNQKPRSEIVDDIFRKAAILEELDDEEFKQRMDEATSPENIQKTMNICFPNIRPRLNRML
jgi:hypothetical protein